jgi:16S rRNA U516 pseudouridylate synthase RsuA-like enzyme
MVAAVGNRVEQLHRFRIGALELPEDLGPGQWRWLQAEEIDALTQSPELCLSPECDGTGYACQHGIDV